MGAKPTPVATAVAASSPSLSTTSAAATTTTTSAAVATAVDLLDITERETFAGLARKLVGFVQAHKTLNVAVIWAVFMLVDLTLNQPLEWLVLLAYSLLVLVRARRHGVASFVVYVASMGTADYVVSTFMSPEGLATIASMLVNVFVVLQLQGMNLRGLVLNSPPSYLRPLAVHCTAFGLGWLVFTIAAAVHDSYEDMMLFAGVMLPEPPLVVVQELTATSLRLLWSRASKSSSYITEYVAEINGELCGRVPSSELSLVAKGLAPNERYRVRVGAMTPRGISFSAPVIVRTPPPPSSLPSHDDNGSDHSGDAAEPANEADASEYADAHLNGTDGPAVASDAGHLSSPSHDPNATASSTTPGSTNTPSTPSHNATDVHDLSEMQEELQRLQKQRSDTDAQIRDLTVQYQAEITALESEIHRLRELKRSEDAPKHKMKQLSKALEEAKTKADLVKAKLEKELRTEEELRDAMSTTLERLQHEQTVVANALRDADEKQQAVAAQHAEDKRAMRAKIDGVRQQTQEAVAALGVLREQMAAVQEDHRRVSDRIATERALLSSILETVAGVHTRHSDKEKEIMQYFDAYHHMIEENRILQDQLREETHQKMALMAELGMARKKRELKTMHAFATPYVPYQAAHQTNGATGYLNGHAAYAPETAFTHHGLNANALPYSSNIGSAAVHHSANSATAARSHTTGHTPLDSPARSGSTSPSSVSPPTVSKASPGPSRRLSFQHSVSTPTLPSVFHNGASSSSLSSSQHTGNGPVPIAPTFTSGGNVNKSRFVFHTDDSVSDAADIADHDDFDEGSFNFAQFGWGHRNGNGASLPHDS